MNNLINNAKHIPINNPVQTISINPVTLFPTKRPLPLDMRITAPAQGNNLPIILLSHGHGPSLYISSKDAYAPLVNFYAQQGFAVIQPTHLNSRVAGLPPSAEGAPLFWKSRITDMSYIIDNLDKIERSVPVITSRLDHTRIAVVGHSLGGMTASMLLGSLLTDTQSEVDKNVNMHDPRIRAGVLLAAPGNGGDNLTPYAAQNYSCMNPNFTTMITPALVIAGSDDMAAHITVKGPKWFRDPYEYSPGASAMLTLKGGKHGLGGIAGYDAKETDDEDPDRLAITQRMSLAYLKSALYPQQTNWKDACSALTKHCQEHALIELK